MMNRKKRVLAFDLGASSGRAVLACLENDRIRLTEIHRFPNEPVSCGGHLYWDVLRLLHEIKTGLRKAQAAGGFDSIGIDTWGVDYGLIGKDGSLLGNPFHYRDKRTEGILDQAEALIRPEELYQHTGNQIMQINTAFQLLVQKQETPELLKLAQAFLPMPDLLGYFLTGDVSTEHTIAGTTQLYDPNYGGWSEEVVHAFGLPERLFPALAQTGTVKGIVTESIAKELGIPQMPVIAVCGHDTQSAAVAVPCTDDVAFAFISCGTWALFGTELDHPVMNEQSAGLCVSNEVGFGGTVTFLKNITGLWMIQETKRALHRKGQEYTYADLEKMATQAEPGQRFIDVDAPAFSAPGDMPGRIRAWCLESGQPEPADMADILRCIYESLACKFREALDEIETCTGRRLEKIYMLGGGVKDGLLCQLTANVCGIPVYTGPDEATALGNAAVQMISDGTIADLREARTIIGRSVTVRRYAPEMRNAYIYDNYQSIFKKEM